MTRLGPLVGRQQQLAELTRLMHLAAERRGALVLLGGEAGVGKHALVGALLDDAADQGWRTATGRSAGPGETPPFGPWLEAVKSLQPTEPLPPPFGGAGAPVSLPDMAAALSVGLGTQPLVVVLEALHGADPATLELLKYMAPRLSTLPVLLIATYRSDQIERAHPLWLLLPELQRAGAVRMALDRLTQQAVTELVQSVMPADTAVKTLAWQLFERTGGNPLFLTELLDPRTRKRLRAAARQPLPETLRQALDERLSRLGAPAEAAVQAAAILGERFAAGPLARLLEAPADSLRDALAEAAALQVIQPEEAAEDQFRFTHSSLREVLLDRLMGSRRRRWHQRAAEALMAEPQPDPAAIARHLSEAGDLRAAAYLLPAGDAALGMGALTQAGHCYTQALELLPAADPGRPELLLKFGMTLRHTDPARAAACWTEAARAAEAAGDRVVSAWARHLLVSHGKPAPGPEWQEAAAWVQSEQQSLQGEPRYRKLEAQLFGKAAGYPRVAAGRARLLLAAGQIDEAADLTRQTMANALPDADLEAFRPITWQLALFQNRIDEAVAQGAETLGTLLRQHHYSHAVEWAGHHLRLLLRYRGDSPAEVDGLAAQLTRLEAGAAAERPGVGAPALGYYQFMRGHWAKAAESLLGPLARQPATPDIALRIDAARLQIARGDLAGARTTLAPLSPRLPDEGAQAPGPPSAAVHLVRAEYHMAAGEMTEARAWLEGADRLAEQKHLAMDRSRLRLAWAEFCLRTGDSARCRAMAQEALLYAGGVNDCCTLITGRRLLAACSASQRAEDEFAAALDLAERCRFPYEAALVRLARVKALPSSRYAGENLRLARETFARLGAAPALDEAERLLIADPPANLD